MTTASQLYVRFGAPELEHNMAVLIVPVSLGLAHVPHKIYCNRAIHKPLLQAFTSIANSGFQDKIKTWDGCFCLRKKRGGRSASLHSWGYAVDINAAWNQMGKVGTQSMEIVKCFKDAGFDWGGDWKGKCVDGMHMEYSHVPPA
jgi:hypothetical protein